MREKLNSYISFMSGTRPIAVLAVLYLVNQVVIGYLVSPLGHEALKLQTTLSHETFRSIILAWEGAGHMPVYIRHFFPDSWHPLIYSLFLSALISRGAVMSGPGTKISFLVLLPFGAGIMDVLENVMHLYMITDRSGIGPAAVMFSGICTNTKWALALASIIVAVALPLVSRRSGKHILHSGGLS